MATTESGRDGAIMAQNGTQAAYSQEERERLRLRILDYMDSHQIGVPTLQQRIAAATGRSADEIPLSTLQRFLVGRRRTNDVFVKLCQTFVLTLAAAQGYAAFGEALGAFYRAADGKGDSDAATCAKLAGQFQLFGRAENGEAEQTPFASLELSPMANIPFSQAKENVIDEPGRNNGQKLTKARRREFDGVALARDGGLLVILRDVLTRADRAYRLEEVTRAPEAPNARTLAGHGFDRPFRATARSPAPVIPLNVIAMRAGGP